MTSRERLETVLAGKSADRIPVFTQIPFALSENGFVPGAFHGYADHDDWRKEDPAYRRLLRRMEGECDNLFIWRPPCMDPEQLFIPQVSVVTEERSDPSGKIIVRSRLEHGGLQLQQVEAVQPGTGHTWVLEHYCKTAEDAGKLLDLTYDAFPPESGDFSDLENLLGDKGLMCLTIPSPLMPACRLFDPSEFLVFSRTEPVLIHDLVRTAQERIAANLRSLLDQGVGPIVRFGGAEHATPPLMAPTDFDELVVRYDTPLVDMCKGGGRFVAYHCHGRIRHALGRFVEMGVDLTDPVETLPDGDIDLAEAREITEHRLTLCGNIQMREIASADPSHIEERIKGIVREAGPERLIVTTTGTPLERMDPVTERNYHAMIDAVLEHGSL